MVVILDFDTLRDTKPQIFSPQRHDDHTRLFYMGVPPPPLFDNFLQNPYVSSNGMSLSTVGKPGFCDLFLIRD